MEFKKLALAAAVAALPATGFSMEAMEDSALSGVTGQDGISIALNTNLSASLIVHDTDGIQNAAGTAAATYTTVAGTGTTAVTTVHGPYGSAAALVMEDFAINTAGGDITLDIDAGDSATAGVEPVLNIQVGIPTGTQITLGSVDVANSNRDDGGWGVVATGRVDDVLNLGSVTLGATTMNIQLANEPQGDMIALNTTITGGIGIANFALNDANSGGGIGVDNVAIVGNGIAAGDLAVDAGINVDGNGLVVRLDTLGSATGADVRLTGVNLGDGSGGNLGDIELVGLQLSGTTLTISGH